MRASGTKRKPRLAVTSRPAEGPTLEGGGKSGVGLREGRRGTTRPLDRWLLSLGRGTEGPREKVTEQTESKGGQRTPGGQRGTEEGAEGVTEGQ